ncbi:MFS transporter [Sporolactobacillus spathodeae]|uniref:Multidrug resistance protein n=1 Tax=Sporolactobacillus spathodeae TaxID=1465502 RepID=A0ABS2Q9P0_9BACL|nr:MFS transporter [Sporolactobacillus spathodeae]MBM7658506.1 multidrug resistance protein [Sporolactobacillus spathodeae]
MHKVYQIHSRLTLLALAISAFGIGSTEFISVGLLPLIVKDFGISLSSASLTVSMYALGVTIGAPLLTVLTARLSRKAVLLFVMLLFIGGNLLAAVSPSFPVLLSGRVISALAHGVFMSVASVIAADVVAPNKRASAIAIMFTGLTVATVTGVPLGTFIGQMTQWRMTFLFIVLIGVLALIANIFLVPGNLSKAAPISLKDIAKVLSNFRLLLILIITALGYGGTFVSYTYVSPILSRFMGYSARAIVILLVVYGIAVAIGNTLGGHLSNNRPLFSLFFMFLALAASIFGIFIFINSHILGMIMVLLMGLFAFMNVPGLQLYAVQLAERYTPGAIPMASALNISAFNIGIALGSELGGRITAQMGLAYTPIFGSMMVLLAAFIVFFWLVTEWRSGTSLCRQNIDC